jgi:hypothetical protein
LQRRNVHGVILSISQWIFTLSQVDFETNSIFDSKETVPHCTLGDGCFGVNGGLFYRAKSYPQQSPGFLIIQKKHSIQYY